jgi:GNAT superfamily N-acetyltransferase
LQLEIRDAAAEDVGVIVGVLLSSKQDSLAELLGPNDLNVEFWTERWRGYITEGSRAQMSSGDGFALIAENRGTPVGFAAYHHTHRHGADVELESVYVLKDAQRKGIGSALVRAVAKRLVSNGDRSMCVGYDPRNPYKRFYLKLGAVEINPHWAIWRDLATVSVWNQKT